ncbi:E3 ubiquitin-protein ligase PUB24-like [Lycium barbarum]|uniref:E3 ubiquitin-protein ligase PUB24-like n=1 Tax=Lycium barbarum TaxID=112863 RepID=UPI00293ECD49|nr:E3 ubiquitin-protein ligase PUB24-like [Lycium barbarum]
MENIEVPEYFICPISLQIMKDPVTAITGITYDRESIERWLFKNPNNNVICPVTKVPVPRDSDLTPNHTLRRLIQAWCIANGSNGVDRILTPKPPLSKFYVLNLVLDLSVTSTKVKTLEKLELLAKENERNKTYMVEAGVHKALIKFLIKCYKKCDTNGLEKTLSTLSLIWDLPSCNETKVENYEEVLIDSITWALGLDHRDMQKHAVIKNHAMNLLRSIIGKVNSSTLERLKPQLFEKIIGFLRDSSDSTITIAQKGVNAALHVMLDTSTSRRNRNMMIESRTIFELIELELKLFLSNKKTIELIFGILFNLCSCADGRAQLLSHAAGIAMITKRILKVSPAIDEKGMLILCLISKYSATSGVLQEMLKVKTVSKICTVIQADCPSFLKDKAMEILRSHFDVWRNSPCVELATLTRYP